MGLNIAKFRDRRDETKAKHDDNSGFYKFPDPKKVGEATEVLLYLPPPTEEMDGIPYVEVRQHFKVGPAGKPVICLGEENEVLWTEPLAAALAERNERAREKGNPILRLDKSRPCPICEAYAGDRAVRGMSDSAIKAMEPKDQWLFVLVPWGEFESGRRGGRERVEYRVSEQVPRFAWVGFQIWDGITARIDEAGDITEPDNATLLVVKKEKTGNKAFDIKYTVTADVETLRTPIRVSKPIWAAVREQFTPGGDCDPFRLIANMLKTYDDAIALLEGGEVEKGRAVEEGKPTCFARDCDPKFPECAKCDFLTDCAKECGVELPKRGAVGGGGRSRGRDEDEPRKDRDEAPRGRARDEEAPRGRARDDEEPRGRSRDEDDEPRGRGRAEASRGRSRDDDEPRGRDRAEEAPRRGRDEEPRGRSRDEDVPRSRSREEDAPRSRSREEDEPRGRARDEAEEPRRGRRSESDEPEPSRSGRSRDKGEEAPRKARDVAPPEDDVPDFAPPAGDEETGADLGGDDEDPMAAFEAELKGKGR